MAGWACAEGLLEEDGRSTGVSGEEGRQSPKAPPGNSTTKVGRLRPKGSGRGPTGERAVIKASPERRHEAPVEVGGAHSSEEAAVMAGDAKGPHFGAAPEENETAQVAERRENLGNDTVRELQETLYRAAKANETRRFHSLIDKVERPDVLKAAWAQVRANGDAAGVDGTTIEDIEKNEESPSFWKG